MSDKEISGTAMATLIDFSTVTHKVNEWIDAELGIDTASKAFMPLMVASILDVTEEEAYDSITDGGQDRGVDALFVDDRDGKNTIHVFQFKYTEDFSKSKSNFPSNEIDKILSFLNDLLDKDIDMQNNCNSILFEKVKEAWQSLSKKNPAIEVHFCSNTLPMVPDERDRLRKAFEKWNGVGENHYGLDEIINLFLSVKRPKIDRDIRIIDRDYYDRTDGNVRALICTIDAAELVKLISDPDEKNRL